MGIGIKNELSLSRIRNSRSQTSDDRNDFQYELISVNPLIKRSIFSGVK